MRAGILPLNLLIFSRSLDIKILMLFRILLMEILEIPIKFAIFSSFNIFCKILKNLSKFLFLKFANGLYTYFLTSLRLLFIITSTKSQFLCLYSLGEKLPWEFLTCSGLFYLKLFSPRFKRWDLTCSKLTILYLKRQSLVFACIALFVLNLQYFI